MTRPTRVLELRSVRGTGGGPDKTILLGTAQTDRSRFVVTVCYLRDRRDPDFTIDQRARDLGLDYTEILERHSFDPSIWTQAAKLVREGRYDIIHAHDYKTNLLAWFLARRLKVVPLSTVHGWFGLDKFRERIYYAADRRVLASFPRVVAVSGPLKTQLVRAGCRADRIDVIPNGIDHQLFKRDPAKVAAARDRLGLKPGEVAIGAIGRLERQKRFDLLMEAVAALHSRHGKLKLFIAGEGSARDRLSSVRDQLGLQESCVFLGHQPDIIGLHHAFDLFVQASDDEGSPNVVLEAMALETPVVATDVGGTGDLINSGTHGLLVRPGDLEALRDAIGQALSDPAAMQRCAMAARGRIERELSFTRRMARVEAIYDQLVSR